jgi:hypothetical protein
MLILSVARIYKPSRSRFPASMSTLKPSTSLAYAPMAKCSGMRKVCIHPAYVLMWRGTRSFHTLLWIEKTSWSRYQRRRSRDNQAVVGHVLSNGYVGFLFLASPGLYNSVIPRLLSVAVLCQHKLKPGSFAEGQAVRLDPLQVLL